jgi:hypothetical protein
VEEKRIKNRIAAILWYFPFSLIAQLCLREFDSHMGSHLATSGFPESDDGQIIENLQEKPIKTQVFLWQTNPFTIFTAKTHHKTAFRSAWAAVAWILCQRWERSGSKS